MLLPALDRLPVPVFLSRPDGSLSYVNDAWRAALGTDAGSHWASAFPDLNHEQLEPQWRACWESLEPFVCHTVAGSLQYRIVCQPAQPDGEADVQVLGTLTDVTREALIRAESEAIMDTAVDAIITIDEDGDIQTFNAAAAKLFGYRPAEVVGAPVTMLMPEPHRTGHDAYLRNYLETGVKKIIGIGRELEAVDRKGRRIPIYLAVSEMNVEGRRRFAGIIRDLTDQQAARAALVEQREKLAHVSRLSSMGEMTASIAHEINQPLTAISMYAQAGIKLIDRAGATDLDAAQVEKLRAALTKLNTQSLRAGAVIERIQRFARAEDRQPETVDVNELLEDLLKLAESDARLHDIELVLDLAPDLPAVFGDPIQIQQVALNLIRNAIDAMLEIGCAAGREIDISTRPEDGDRVRVAVRDRGPGVADDQKDLLFTPFHTTKKDGMGMGLSICRSIIAEHGGVLTYRNEPGGGATFQFTLPVGSDHD